MSNPLHEQSDDQEAPDGMSPVAADGGEERGGVSRPAPHADQSAADRDSGAGASPGNTHLLSSQEEELDPPLVITFDDDRPLPERALTAEDGYSGPLDIEDRIANASVDLDWLELGGLIRWDESNETMLRLRQIHERAVEVKQPEPYVLAGQEVLIQPRGMGSGRQQRLSVVLEWNGCRLAFTPKDSIDRQHANLYINIPGEPCVIYGGRHCLDVAHQMIEEMGGWIFSTWFKRLDICCDLPGVDLAEEFLPAFRDGQFVTSASYWNAWDGREGVSGFTVGSSKRVQLNVYDKTREVVKKSELYQLAMKLRWGGSIPRKATRIEYQIRKQWFDQFALTSADEVLALLPEIVARLTEVEKRSFFVLTSQAVDRGNKHQSRCPRLPAWLRAVATFRALSGEPTIPLERAERSQISCFKAVRSAVGYLTSAAAGREACVTTTHDLVEFLREMLDFNDIRDEDVASSWEKKARKLGIYRASQDFQFGERSNRPPEPAGEDECF